MLTDLHRLCGAWSIWFLIIMSLTGKWYLVQAIMWHADVELEPYPEALPISQVYESNTGKPDVPVSLSDAMIKAEQIFDTFTPSFVAILEHSRDSYKFPDTVTLFSMKITVTTLPLTVGTVMSSNNSALLL